jgi:Zn ribbon nucleic-acid-binding protein
VRSPMALPLTRPCPVCGAEMELVISDEARSTYVYECTECGFQTREAAEGLEEVPEEEWGPEELEEFESEEDEEI